MKRITTLLLALTLIVSTFSCGRTVRDDEQYKSSYKYENATLEGVDIRSYTIVISRNAYMNAAKSLSKALSRYNGYGVPIKKLSEITDSDQNLILIGDSNLDGTKVKNYGDHGYGIVFSEGERVTVSVDFSVAAVLDSAIKRLISLIHKDSDGTTAVLTLSEKECYGFSFEEELSRWTLKEEATFDVSKGITYTYQRFSDQRGFPYRVYVLKIDPSKFYLYMGTSGDGYDFTVDQEKRQTVLQHIEAAVGNGVVPIAAVNADFFNISSDYSPKGLCIKEGTVISEANGRPWCGYTYDGRFVCGRSSLYEEYEGQLRTAVGASDVLVDNGVVIKSTTEGPHPRTLAGVAEDGTIILAVIDGRQPGVSNGAVFARCAMLMLSYGAYNAVNLDGGGSSTMIVMRDGNYETVNSPSDGGLRKVYNSLLIVPRDQ